MSLRDGHHRHQRLHARHLRRQGGQRPRLAPRPAVPVHGGVHEGRALQVDPSLLSLLSPVSSRLPPLSALPSLPSLLSPPSSLSSLISPLSCRDSVLSPLSSLLSPLSSLLSPLSSLPYLLSPSSFTLSPLHSPLSSLLTPISYLLSPLNAFNFCLQFSLAPLPEGAQGTRELHRAAQERLRVRQRLLRRQRHHLGPRQILPQQLPLRLHLLQGRDRRTIHPSYTP